MDCIAYTHSRPDHGADLSMHANTVWWALAGLSQVQMEWGQAQEPASVLDLVSIFPDSAVEEVGLCMVRCSDLMVIC